jgi:hypothetical protein
MRAMIEDGLLDTSKFPRTHPLFGEANTQIGNFKDESKGTVTYKEWIFLRPKCYSLLTDKDEATKKAKGISLKQTTINHDSYRHVFEDGAVVSVPQKKFVSKQHQLFTSEFSKVALSGNDNKRCWVEKNRSVAYGHYSLL